MLHWTLVITAVVCVTASTAVGVAAVTREWVPPFGRVLVLRPRLWGTGVLMSALGLSLFMFLGPLGSDDLAVNFYVPLVGMAVNFAGLAVQALARRPGRTPGLPPTSTTTAS
ncbi:hypothetical protein OG562_27975 [Streptomyces sp. NBC_01275]|uniref:hypothetical protein n=1 Tax=Streptomyces sp. NBC_01275 TaxID=2903807 RepID=UPI00225A205E|nr:hypothetical protein [Streptomyces sp. NBC_01275]MCX4764739.1 hypothetical protein [Streptomyces sp. NBC_01275]